MPTSNPTSPHASKLLLHEEPLQVLPALAVALGLNEAIILQQLHYWLRRKSHDRDEKQWFYNTYADWQKQFPFWSISTIKRTMISLEKQGAIFTANYNNSPIDKTKWYAVNYEKLNELSLDTTAQNEPSTDQNDLSTAHNEPSTAHIDPTTGQNDTLQGSTWPHQYQETNTETTDRDLQPPVSNETAPAGEVPRGEAKRAQESVQPKRTKGQKQPNTFFTPGFERMWQSLPVGRKIGKVETFAIWRARNLEPRTDEIIEKLERLKGTVWHEKELKYIPMPETWFNKARYEDELVPLSCMPSTPPNNTPYM